MADSPICMTLNNFSDLTNHLSAPWRCTFFTVFLVEQMKLKEKSKYWDYLKTFKSDLSHFPVAFDDKEQLLLTGCDYMSLQIMTTKTRMVQDFKLLQMAYPDLEKEVTYPEFREARMSVNQRIFDLAFTDGIIRQVMIPFLEFAAINWGTEGANVNCLQMDSQMKLKANKDIKKGEVIVQADHNSGNAEILINAGHTMRHNKNDKVYLKCEIKESDPMF